VAAAGARPAKGRSAGIPRQRLLAVAAELFATRGYRATSLEDIGTALQVKKTAIYHYVNAKDDLLVAIFEDLLDRMQAGAQAVVAAELPPEERLRRLIHNHVQLATEHHHMLAVIFREESELPAAKRAWQQRRKRAYERIFQDAIEQGQETGALRPLNPRLTLSALFGMCNWLYQWYRPGEWDPEVVAGEFMLLLERGWLAGADDVGEPRGAWPRPSSVEDALQRPRQALDVARQDLDRLAAELDRAADRLRDGTAPEAPVSG
jgi:AcrR family transcriptional regulator